jgi:hypothetical protein
MFVPSMAPHLGHVIANTFECVGGSPLQFSWRATTYVIACSQIGHFASLITLFHLLIQDVLATFSQELKDFALFLSRRRRRGCSVFSCIGSVCRRLLDQGAPLPLPRFVGRGA